MSGLAGESAGTALAEPPAGVRSGAAPGLWRLLRTEVRHSAFVWVIPLLALLFYYDPFRTLESYPSLWPLRSTVALNKWWPDNVAFAAGFSAWAGTREGRRGVADLLGTTARPAWTRRLCAYAGTAFWVVATFLAGVVALDVTTSLSASWGSVPAWPVVVGVLGLLAVCAVAFTAGALFPGRFTAPVAAVAIFIVTLVAFRQAVGDNGGSSGAVGVLSPDGSVPDNDWGLYYPTSAGVPLVQSMFMLGIVTLSFGILGLSPRAGGAGWRGALSAVTSAGARVRAVALSFLIAGVALVVTAFGLAGTANVNDPTSTLRIPALDGSPAALAYTPACSSSAGLRVCVHPAYQPYLPVIASALGAVAAAFGDAPGVPASARAVLASTLPAQVQQGAAFGQLNGGAYTFSLGSMPFSVTPAEIRVPLQVDLVHEIVVGNGGRWAGPDGSQFFLASAGTPAQQAVVDGVLKALGDRPYQVAGDNGLPAQPVQADVSAAAGRFAAQPASSRTSWLAANLAGLRAGTVTLGQVP